MTRTRFLLTCALVCIALSIVAWFSLNTVRHVMNDHTLLHQLVKIEIAREQAAPPPK